MIKMDVKINRKSRTKQRSEQARVATLNIQRKYMRLIKNAYESTCSNWKPEDTPVIDARQWNTRMPDEVGIDVGPVPGSHGYDIWRYLNGGTSIRWAVLSDDWQSKTSPDYIESQEGSGYVKMRGRDMIDAGIPPGPGILARDWAQQIKEKYGDAWRKAINQAIHDAMK